MVLIIDDESDLRGLIVDVLESQGIEAQAVGPYDALLMLRQLEPEVVLLDVVMPGMDGYNILKYMRSDARLRNSFVLMLTGKARTQDLQVGIDLGADDYLTKPFAVEELVARVRIGLNAAGRISA
ncbi:MAG: response regulator [Chloroflexota bacterium]|nr:response regulator [Chloroflexota bacterium]